MTRAIGAVILPAHPGMATDFLPRCPYYGRLTNAHPNGKTVQMSGVTTNVITGIAASLLLLFVLMVVSYVARKAARRKF